LFTKVGRDVALLYKEVLLEFAEEWSSYFLQSDYVGRSWETVEKVTDDYVRSAIKVFGIKPNVPLNNSELLKGI